MMNTIFNNSPELQTLEIAGMKVLVVDNALNDPDRFRAQAVENSQSMVRREVGIGYELHPHPRQFQEMYPGFSSELGRIVHSNLGEYIRSFFGLDASYSLLRIFKGPVFNCAYKLPYFPPHVDPGHMSTFIYLNLPEQCSGGTGIYRHRPSNRTNVVQESTDLGWMATKSLNAPLSYSTEDWELLHRFDMKYNRLVVFNASTIHKIFFEPGVTMFKEDVANVRLTLNNFFVYSKPSACPSS